MGKAAVVVILLALIAFPVRASRQLFAQGGPRVAFLRTYGFLLLCVLALCYLLPRLGL